MRKGLCAAPAPSDGPPGWPAPGASGGPPPPREGRIHEVEGPGARAFAVTVAALALAARPGALIWIQNRRAPSDRTAGLDGFGLAAHLNPGRLILAQAADETDTLWAFEESLRSGAAAIVVAELAAAPDLTAGRRLNLAAQGPTEAAAAQTPRPIGVAVLAQSADGAGATAAETRWRAAPAPGWAEGGAATQRWRLLKNKRGPAGAWDVRLRAPDPARGAASGGTDAGSAENRLALDAEAWRGAAASA